MTKEQKSQIIKEYATSENDVGSAQVQVAILSFRILELTEHLKIHSKDHSSRRGLIALVNRRRKLLGYINRKSHEQYINLIRRLNLRR